MASERYVFMLETFIQLTKSGHLKWSVSADPSFGVSYRSRWKDWTHIEVTRESGEILYCKVYDRSEAEIEMIGFDSTVDHASDYYRFDQTISAKLEELWLLLQSLLHVVN